MKNRMDAVLAELRRRAESRQPWAADPGEDALARALHELDVYHAELEIQNEELRETQLELERARDEYRRLFEEAPVPILSLSPQGVVLAANRAALELVERAPGALVDRPFAVCLAAGEPDRFFRHLLAVVEARAPQRVELELLARGGARRQVVIRTALAPRAGAELLLAHLTDITEQRAAEVARAAAERQLREGETLQAIGRVAASIAHDVNHVLALVVTQAELVKAAAGSSPEVARDLDALLDAAWRGARLMRGLLGLSRGSGAAPRRFELGPLLVRVAALLEGARPGVAVTAVAEGAPAHVAGDEEALLHALLAVATNGVEATAAGEVELRCRAPAPRAGFVEVTVRDRGAGMSEETRARAFEPLFTTRGAVGGAGLGLTLAQRTIAAHGGAIALASAPGAGTTVTIELPLVDAAGGAGAGAAGAGGAAAAGVVVGAAAAVLRGMRVLIVDDDERVRAALRRQLETLGASVRDYGDGRGAYGAVGEGYRFDVAVVDVNMPGWTGPELVRRLFDALGPCPVLFVTGASGDLVSPDLLDRDYVRLLRKPWTRRDLTDSIAAVRAAASLAAE